MTEDVEEVENYRASIEAVDVANRRVVRLVVALCLLVLVIIIAVGAFVAVEVQQVRQSQVRNTQIATARADCQSHTFEALAKDFNHALQGDRNPIDYPPVKTC